MKSVTGTRANEELGEQRAEMFNRSVTVLVHVISVEAFGLDEGLSTSVDNGQQHWDV